MYKESEKDIKYFNPNFILQDDLITDSIEFYKTKLNITMNKFNLSQDKVNDYWIIFDEGIEEAKIKDMEIRKNSVNNMNEIKSYKSNTNTMTNILNNSNVSLELKEKLNTSNNNALNISSSTNKTKQNDSFSKTNQKNKKAPDTNQRKLDYYKKNITPSKSRTNLESENNNNNESNIKSFKEQSEYIENENYPLQSSKETFVGDSENNKEINEHDKKYKKKYRRKTKEEKEREAEIKKQKAISSKLTEKQLENSFLPKKSKYYYYLSSCDESEEFPFYDK